MDDRLWPLNPFRPWNRLWLRNGITIGALSIICRIPGYDIHMGGLRERRLRSERWLRVVPYACVVEVNLERQKERWGNLNSRRIEWAERIEEKRLLAAIFGPTRGPSINSLAVLQRSRRFLRSGLDALTVAQLSTYETFTIFFHFPMQEAHNWHRNGRKSGWKSGGNGKVRNWQGKIMSTSRKGRLSGRVYNNTPGLLMNCFWRLRGSRGRCYLRRTALTSSLAFAHAWLKACGACTEHGSIEHQSWVWMIDRTHTYGELFPYSIMSQPIRLVVHSSHYNVGSNLA